MRSDQVQRITRSMTLIDEVFEGIRLRSIRGDRLCGARAATDYGWRKLTRADALSCEWRTVG
jgi:hypothetical protein